MDDSVLAALLSKGDLDQLNFFKAAFSDKENKARIDKMIAAQHKVEAKIAELQAVMVKNNEVLVVTQDERIAAEKIRNDAATRGVQLTEWEGRLRDMQEALKTEQAAWETVRQKVDADQAKKAGELAAEELRHEKWEKDLLDRKDDIARREKVVEKIEDRHSKVLAILGSKV